MIQKHSVLEKDLSLGKIEKKLFAEKSRYADLNDITKDAKKYILFEANKLDLEKILNDQKNDKN